jgi:spore coat polysaccharide biosynthesis protein SpsF
VSGGRELTEQEAFWQGTFGDDYARRNDDLQVVAGNTHLFSRILERTEQVGSVLELGANIGMYIRALANLLPAARLDAVEINESAAARLRELGRATVHVGSLFDVALEGQWDLTFCKGVMIHLAPDLLPMAYDRLYDLSSRYVLVAEYYNPSPVEVPYRGHVDRLYKRDFAGEMLYRFVELHLVD